MPKPVVTPFHSLPPTSSSFQRAFPAHVTNAARVARWFGLTLAFATVATFQHIGGDWVSWIIEPSADLFLRMARYWWALFVGVAFVMAALAAIAPWLPRRRLWRLAMLAAAAAAGSLGGWTLAEVWLPTGWPIWTWRHTFIVIAILNAALMELRFSTRASESRLNQAALARARAQSELADGRLRLLQAQIEPHFIFNSLANVRRLLDVDPVAGRSMLADFLRYFEHALPKLRDEAPTLGQEVEGARAYLAVHQVRMGSRLRVEIDVPEAMRDRAIPTMMLITLIENALEHGLRPLSEGGTIRIRAEATPDNGFLVSVADDGCGLNPGVGAGHGLANVRARLSALYAGAAHLTLEVNEPRGVVATLRFPAPARR